jgi:hypothetical protein
MGWHCYRPATATRGSKLERQIARDMQRVMLKHSLTDNERRRCAALKGWRTRRAKERDDA